MFELDILRRGNIQTRRKMGNGSFGEENGMINVERWERIGDIFREETVLSMVNKEWGANFM